VSRVIIQLGVFVYFCLSSPLFADEFMDSTTPLSMQSNFESIKHHNQMADDEVLSLALIIFGPNTKIAVINGRRYREMDQVEGFLVNKIGKNSVMLIKGEKQLRLQILSAVSSSEYEAFSL
jgi:hypothetical protein